MPNNPFYRGICLSSPAFVLLCGAMPDVMAATSADMTVSGQISPPSCDVDLTGVNFDFGSSIFLNPATSTTTLPESAKQTLSIGCAGLTYVGFRSIDNRAASAASGSVSAYGLGTDSLNNNIGWYTIHMSNAIVNGALGYMKYTTNDGTTWTNVTSPVSADLNPYAKQNVTLAISTVNTAGQPPGPIASASIDLSIIPTIAARTTLATASAINLDGSATVELVYP